MTRVLRFRFRAFAAALPFLAMSIGCDTSQAQYKPTSSEARSSLEAALTAWRDGKPYGSVPATPQFKLAIPPGDLASRSSRSRSATRKTTAMEPSSLR